MSLTLSLTLSLSLSLTLVITLTLTLTLNSNPNPEPNPYQLAAEAGALHSEGGKRCAAQALILALHVLTLALREP